MIGNFPPTAFWHAESETLVVAMEQIQFTACLHNASIPTDDSEAATWGRKLLKDIYDKRLYLLADHPKCSIQLIVRKYDTEPV